MNDIHIRCAKKEEFLQVQNLCHKLFIHDNYSYLDLNWPYTENGEKYLRLRINGRKGICLVAIAEVKIVGYLTGAVAEKQSWRRIIRTELENIFIEEEYRGKGIGHQLIQAFLQWSREKQAQISFVLLLSENKNAEEFYRKNSFRSFVSIMETTL